MKVMVMVKATKESEAGVMPSEQLLVDMGRYNEDLANAGIMLAGEGLHPSSRGARVRFSGKNRTVIDGPFTETKELVAGFWLWRVKSMAEAIEWVKRCPNPMEGESEIEIRPVFEPEDFGAALTPELRDQEDRLRAKIEEYHLDPPRYENASEKLIAGFNATYTFAAREKIPEQWHRFAPYLGKVPGQVGADSYGVCWNYVPGKGFDYLTGVEVKCEVGLPNDFTSVRLAECRYAVFTHTKHVSAIPQTLDAIWTKWLPSSDQRPALGPAPSFERYTSAFDPKTGIGGIEIWVPLDG